MPAFAANAVATNTASAPTGGTPMINGMATATNQIAIYEVNSGSPATADNSAQYGIYRASARGTSATAFTATPIDQNNTMTALTTWDLTWNAAPTTTANSQVLQWAQHQRGTFRWVAYDYTKFLRTQAGTGKGLALMCITNGGSTFSATFNIEYEE